ncbi:MAG TPA: hypothetical protein VFA09_04225 [Ktedonobacteraceae bacterium]|nr:hypothetical protein [Ktedonobacteraceae bacterium]
MRTTDPKQGVINTLTDSNPSMKREERGMLAKTESIVFLKEKNYQNTYAYVVRYTSTTYQQWYDTSYVIQNADGSFTIQSGAYCKAEDSSLANKDLQMIRTYLPQIRISAGGEKPAVEAIAQNEPMSEKIIQETMEDNLAKHTLRIGSSSIKRVFPENAPNYRFLVGYLTANRHDVASIRMIPRVGSVEEDEVEENIVLFLSQFSPPITFEFYGPSHTLIATQIWNI